MYNEPAHHPGSRSKACCSATLAESQDRLCEKERSRTSCPSRHSSFLPIRTAGEGSLLSGKLNPSWLATLGFKAKMTTSPTQLFPKRKLSENKIINLKRLNRQWMGSKRSLRFVQAGTKRKCWSPHRDSNPDRSLRRRLLYPVEL